MSIQFVDFLGRASEVDVLLQAFDRVKSGEGIVSWIVGDAGIGKTRLFTELRTRVEHAGGTAAVGHCLQFVNAPYLPFVDVYQGLFDDLPSLVEQQDQPNQPASAKRAASFTVILRQLRDFSKKQPLLLCFEDLHYADSGTLELLQYLNHHLQNSNILLLLTTRDTRGLQRNDVTDFLATSTCAGAQVINLGPLDAGDIHCLVRQALANQSELPRQTLERVEALAEGNPFFAEELLRGVLEHPAQPQIVTDVPISVRSVMGARLRALDAQTRSILSLAAVVGRDFDIDFLHQMSSLPRDVLLAVLHKARAANVIDEVGSNPSQFRYHHALIRTIIYDDLLEAQRRKLHARIAELLERAPPTPNQLFELAYHWAEGGSAK